MNNTHWTKDQQTRLCELLELQEKGEVKILYWNSDIWARPANGGVDLIQVRPGLTQNLGEGEFKICTPGCFHGTVSPHKWMGSRVWMVALYAPFETLEDKSASRKREIIGEILPEEAIFNKSVSCRLGNRYLSGADLSGAELTRANLSGADLSGANLTGANLFRANLFEADLSGADLTGADLSGANLTRANLYKVNLSWAILYGANLIAANLTGANLSGAKLFSGADFTAAERLSSDPEIPGWEKLINNSATKYYLSKIK